MNDLQKKVVWFFKQKFAFSDLLSILSKQGPECGIEEFKSWDCCDLHRSAEKTNRALGVLADELNLAYNLGGVPNSFLENHMRYSGKKFWVDRAPQVESQEWLIQLSKASSVDLPEHKPSWWIK